MNPITSSSVIRVPTTNALSVSFTSTSRRATSSQGRSAAERVAGTVGVGVVVGVLMR